MTSEQVIARMIGALNALAVPHMVVGSLASSFHGIARSTRDADIVIQLGSTLVTALADQLGPEFALDPQMSFETATGTVRHTFHVSKTDFHVELFHLSDDPHDQAIRAPTFDSLPRPGNLDPDSGRCHHYQAALGAAWPKRHKDIDDVRNVIAVQGNRLDWGYVEGWCQQHGTTDLLQQVRGSSEG